MIYAIILAGGIGSRFWPLSREGMPKQFLNIYSDKPMILEAIQRLNNLIKKENIYFATNTIHAKKISNLGISKKNILLEPEGKNTLAPIGLLTKRIYQLDKQAIIVALPSDHSIKEKAKFSRFIRQAISVAQKNYIVILGIKPARPETGYGYIKVNSRCPIKNSKAYKVAKFIEKPTLSKASKFVKGKGYFWNSGIFIFKAEIFLKQLQNLASKTYQLIGKMDNEKKTKKLWPELPSISIDYGIIEKADNLAVLPADCGWIDLGSWQSIIEISRKDNKGNVFKGDHIDMDSKNSLIWSTTRLVATLGLDNIVIADTKDALLVFKKEKAQDIKKLLRLIKKKRKACV